MDIAKRWYERARLSRDDYDRFIYAYIALNYLYAGERRNGEGERACAVRFACEKCVVCQFDPFACDVSEYQRSPVVDMLHTDRCYPVTPGGRCFDWVAKWDSESSHMIDCGLRRGCGSIH